MKNFCFSNRTSQTENNILDCVQDAKVTVYADDTSVENTSRRMSDIKTNLIPDLLSVCDWLKPIQAVPPYRFFPCCAETVLQ